MTVPRVYVPRPLRGCDEVALPAPAHAHLVRVLRLRPGAELILFDGLGGEYRAIMSRCDKKAAWARMAEHVAIERESHLAMTLLQGVSRGDRMDYTLQKATELGAARIVCVFCARSVTRLDYNRLQKRRAHWEGVIGAACEQSGRNRLPELAIRNGLREALMAEALAAPRLLLDPEGVESVCSVSGPVDRATLLVGPEGGLSADEKAEAAAAAFSPVRFGPRILRTETAGSAALTALQVLWGDLR